MKTTFVNILQLLRRNWRSILLFELVYRAILVALAGPIFKLMLDGAMALEGFEYLTHENVSDFLSRPPIVVLFVAVVLVLAIYEMIDIATMHYLLGFSLQDEEVRPTQAVCIAVKQVAKSLRPRKLLLVLYTLLLIPLLGIGVIFGLIFTLEPPELFFEHLSKYMPYVTAGCIAMVVAAILLFRLSFVFAFSFFEDESFVGAVRKSWNISRKHAFGDLLWIVGTQIVVWVAFFLLLALVAVPLAFVVPASIAGLEVSRATLLSSFFLVPAAVISGLLTNTPASCSAILARLLLHNADSNKPLLAESPQKGTHLAAMRVAALVVTLVCLGWGAHHMWTNVWEPMQRFSHDGHTITITAHRGGSSHAPENTLAAFRQGAKDGADVCELDVQMSKDGKIFVSHDSDFNRISGVNKNAWELTYDEVRELDATGERWKGSIEKQYYPLLDEVLDWAAEANMFMNIELKPTGHETNYEQSVVDIIRAHHFENRCIVTSQVYQSIVNAKTLAPELTYVYIARFLYGDAYKMDAASIFSIEENSVKPLLVEGIHDHGKTVLTWTVDSPRGVELAVLNGSDSIITDDVPMVKDVLPKMRH